MTRTLADVTCADATWLHTRADALTAALKASGSDGAADLVEFCRAVTTWWPQGADPAERRRRMQWIEEVVDQFLQSLGPDEIGRLAAVLPTLAAQVNLLAVLAETNMRLRLRPVIELVAERLGREVPVESPAPPDGSWNRMFRVLLTLAGVSGSPAGGLAAVVDRAPAWLLVESLAMLGTLEHYDNFHAALAEALMASRNPAMPDAIARALVAGAPLRLGELLSAIARKAKKDPRAVTLLVAVESALSRAGADDTLRASYVSHWTGWRGYDDDTPKLLAAYLEAHPANHEDVFDLLTRHGTRARSRALPTWGMRGITTTTTMSMRASSVVRRPGEDPVHVHDLPSPDFDAGLVLTSLAPKTVIHLIKAQRDPEFSLRYLHLFSRHPSFVEIAAAIAADAECVARWSSVDGHAAAAVWGVLDELRSRSPELQALRDQLHRTLLPRLPADVLARVGMSLHGDDLFAELGRLVGLRLAEARTLSDAEDLIDAGQNLGFFTPDEMLAVLDLSALVTDAEAHRDGHGYEVATLARVYEQHRWLGEPIIERMAPDHVRELLATAPMFGPRDYDTSHCDTSLALKTRLLRHVAAVDSQAAAEGLAASRERDIRMFFGARLDIPSDADDETREPSAATRWLDTVDEVAPGLPWSYLGSLLASGDLVRDPRAGFSIERNAAWVASWLGRHGREAKEELWRLLGERMDKCAAAGDVDGVVRLAQLVLPGAPSRLRTYRERGVATIKALTALSFTGRGLRDLRALLQKDAPDLAAELPS